MPYVKKTKEYDAIYFSHDNVEEVLNFLKDRGFIPLNYTVNFLFWGTTVSIDIKDAGHIYSGSWWVINDNILEGFSDERFKEIFEAKV